MPRARITGIAAALVAAAVLAAPAQAEAAPAWRYCTTSATGTEISMNRHTADCNYARAVYRVVRRAERSFDGFHRGQRFATLVRHVVEHVRIYRLDSSSFQIKCRSSYGGRVRPSVRFDYWRHA